ncbi:MAG TPA: hypothetical protein VJB57_21305 [Dehalococcoidia bacterium]|nr:hypothetical protein [Dehalococcoidia bacterium]
MVTQDVDQTWADLADAEQASRETQMASRYTELAAMSEEERRSKMEAMVRAEYSLPDEKLRPFTVSRMRTWINLGDDVAKPIAFTYNEVMQHMPATIAMKRVSLVQTLVIEFTPEEEGRLRELAPGAFAGAPSRKTGLERPEDSDLQTQVGKKKPFWKFW